MHFRQKERASERMVGLDVGEHGASASLLGFERGGGVSLKVAGAVDFAEDASEKQIAAAIRTLWKQSGFASYTVCAGIHPQYLLWKSFSYPDLTDDELEAALHLDAEEYTQLSSDQLVMDMHVYDTDEDERVGFYVAVPRKELDRLVRILDMARLFPVIVDISTMALANLYMRFHEEDLRDTAVCVACFDGHHADILILQDRQCVYARSIAAHGSNVQRVAEYISESMLEVIEHSRMAINSVPVGRIEFAGESDDLDETMTVSGKLTGLPVNFWDPLDSLRVTRHVKRHWPAVSGGANSLVNSLGLGLRRAV